MKPAIVLPFHDPGGLVLPLFTAVTPHLKGLFEQAFVSISPPTQARQPEWILSLQQDRFFVVNFNQPGSLPGDHYLAGYRSALAHVPSDTPLHLCDIDRVAYTLLTGFHAAFAADVQAASRAEGPLLFQRSPQAWSTYPQHYYELEHMLIRVGELLYNRYLDFAWSHMVIRASLLADLLPRLRSRDFGLLIEMVLLLEDRLETKEVDWLAWEDPFILGRDPAELRAERDASREETVKRLRGLLPFFQHFLTLNPDLNTQLKWDKSK